MKLTISVLIFMTLFYQNSPESPNFPDELSSQDVKLIESVCKIANDALGTKNDTQDILVGHIGGSRWTQDLDNLIQCFDKGTAVIVSDFLKVIVKQNLRKASVIVMISNQADSVSMNLNLV